MVLPVIIKVIFLIHFLIIPRAVNFYKVEVVNVLNFFAKTTLPTIELWVTKHYTKNGILFIINI